MADEPAQPVDNPLPEGWQQEQVVFDAAEGLRVRAVDEQTVGPGEEQTLFIHCMPIAVSRRAPTQR